MNVLLIDNYDSFTHNLMQALWTLGAEVQVVRNDAIDRAGVERLQPSHVVLSPGPGRPENPADFGICADLIDTLVETPMLGVCLGHQGVGWRMGAKVVQAPEIVHGKTSPVQHDGIGLFAGLPATIQAMRYHSLVLERSSLPPCLQITAETANGLVMGVRHRDRPLFGIQFHPESIGTPTGVRLLGNFLEGP